VPSDCSKEKLVPFPVSELISYRGRAPPQAHYRKNHRISTLCRNRKIVVKYRDKEKVLYWLHLLSLNNRRRQTSYLILSVCRGQTALTGLKVPHKFLYSLNGKKIVALVNDFLPVIHLYIWSLPSDTLPRRIDQLSLTSTVY
jgi:hypothetical protein